MASSDAVGAFNRHEIATNGIHQCTSSVFSSFTNNARGKTQPIDVMIDTTLRKKIADNRIFLSPIVDTIILCGRLSLPLRGHRDDSSYHPEVGRYSKGGVGNFIELLNFRVRAGDINLGEHMRKSAENASYISKTTQNDLIKCCGSVISDQIICEVKEAKFFSIIADEAADSSGQTKLYLCFRKSG